VSICWLCELRYNINLMIDMNDMVFRGGEPIPANCVEWQFILKGGDAWRFRRLTISFLENCLPIESRFIKEKEET